MKYRSQITKFTSYYNGKDGTSVNILGSYETYDALKAEHPTGAPGESYIIGEDLYVWSVTNEDWINVGRIQGPQGNSGKDGKDGKDGAPALPAKTSENIRVFLLNNSPSQTSKPNKDSLGNWTTTEPSANSTNKYVWTCTGNKVTTHAWGNPNSPSLDNIITTITYESWTKPELWGAYGAANIDQKTYATFLKLMNGKTGGLDYDENGNLYVKAELVYANNILVKDDYDNVVLSATSGSSTVPVIMAGWQVSTGYINSGATYLYSKDQLSQTSAGGSSSKAWRIKISDQFGVTSSGHMACTSGKIGGWTIGTAGLTYGTAGNANFTGLYTSMSDPITVGSHSDRDWRFVIGTTFGVTQGGAMYATSGQIGGWTINASSLTSGDVTLYSSTSPYLTVGGSSSSNWRIKVSNTFGVTNGGHMACSSGRVGGWSISASGLTYGTSGGDTFAGLYTGTSPSIQIGTHKGDDWRFILGTKFGVTTSGTMHASAGEIGSSLSKGLLTIDSALTMGGSEGSASATETYFSLGIDPSVYRSIGVGARGSHFYLGSGGLILRNPATTFPYQSGNGTRYGGIRLTYTSMYISGNSDSNTPSSCFSSMTGNGIKFGYMAGSKPTLNGGAPGAETDMIFPKSGVAYWVEYFLTGKVLNNTQFDWFTDRGKIIRHRIPTDGVFKIQGNGPSYSVVSIESATISIGLTNDTVTTKGTWTGSWAGPSDRRLKNSISAYDRRYELFFDALKPCRFKFNEPSNNNFAYNTGFIAQEVEEAMFKAGLTDDDWSGLVTMFEDTEKEHLALYYSDFIALNTWQIQLLKPRMSAAEQEIAQLKSEIQQLRTEIKNLKNS